MEKAGILLTNRKGGFAWLGSRPESRYQGIFFRLGRNVFKTISDIRIDESLQEVTNMLWGVRRDYSSVSQRIVIPSKTNSVIVELSSPAKQSLFLDCKMIDDNRVWGRNYEIKQEKDLVVVSFKKKNDKRDDDSSLKDEYSFFVVITGEMKFFPVQQWVEQNYGFDESRNSPPYSRWVFNLGMIDAQRFVISAGLSKKEAVMEARKVLKSRMQLVQKQVKEVSEISRVKMPMPKKISLAYQCACNALDSLRVNDEGVYAGIPWFYQFWLRDEAVCCNALRSIGRNKLVKNILDRHLLCFSKKILPKAYGGVGLQSMDGPGWIALRYLQNKDLFNKKEQVKALQCLKNVFLALKSKMKSGLVHNGPLETWMDTSVGDKDTRKGARIEIQALMLALARILGEKEFEKELLLRVRETFWNGNYLQDGAGDPMIRPNVFVAAYVYPDLLSREEWESCFDTVLPKLWLSWGGLSSIDVNNELFIDNYTGQDNVSYHRGDSWFWINNLAALLLYRTNAMKYKPFIEKIVEASSFEILELGVMGHHAEVSSARALSSRGCVSQAWSSAMFIELCNELF